MEKVGAWITLCGRLQLVLGGESRESLVRGRQGRLLLAYLLLHRDRPVSRSELVEALWTSPPGDGALAPVLSRLRGVVAPGSIDGRDSLVLRLPEPTWIDVEVAREALSRARQMEAPADVLAAARE